MWLADNDIVQANQLERETLLTVFSMLNTKMAQAIATKRHNMKHSGRSGNH